MSRDVPTIHDAKRQARRLRTELAASGTEISHAQALERMAHLHGFRDWNTFFAAGRDRTPPNWMSGGRVAGHYLSQPFAATVLSSGQVQPGWFRLVLELDQAVDVVRSEKFSNRRKQIRCVIGPDGFSKERTSDGEPHLRLEA